MVETTEVVEIPEVTANGSELPVSMRDVKLVESLSTKGLQYLVKPLNYHKRTKVTSLMLRSGLRAAGPDEFRQELRKALPSIYNHEEWNERKEVLRLLDLAVAGEEWSAKEETVIQAAEIRARQQWSNYSAMYATRYEWNRLYNWEAARRMLNGFEGGSLVWEVDHEGLPTESCLEQIDEDDIAEIANKGGQVSSLNADEEKNSDLPSV